MPPFEDTVFGPGIERGVPGNQEPDDDDETPWDRVVTDETPVVHLRVPIEFAMAWEPWLDVELSAEAVAVGVGYDGGEQDEDVEEHDFFNATLEQVTTLTNRVMIARGIDLQVRTTGADELTLLAP